MFAGHAQTDGIACSAVAHPSDRCTPKLFQCIGLLYTNQILSKATTVARLLVNLDDVETLPRYKSFIFSPPMTNMETSIDQTFFNPHTLNSIFSRKCRPTAFTLIELLVVIVIIGVLAALLLPLMSLVQNRANIVKARSDERQIVGSVMAFSAEYGRTPVPPDYRGNDQYTYGEADLKSSVLMNILSANISKQHGETDATVTLVENLNPSMTSYFDWPVAKNAVKPKGGLGPNDGQPYDPWGRTYIIRVDANGDGLVPNPYSGSSAGGDPLHFQAIAWSFGRDGLAAAIGADKNSGVAADDVISWQ